MNMGRGGGVMPVTVPGDECTKAGGKTPKADEATTSEPLTSMKLLRSSIILSVLPACDAQVWQVATDEKREWHPIAFEQLL